MSNTTPQNGVFINGKAQVIEMLKYMDETEKSRILQLIRIKNPTLAEELSQEILTFESLDKIDIQLLRKVCSNIRPEILGIALNSMNQNFQRSILSKIDRNFAGEAFKTMQANLNSEQIRRAQSKILSIISQVTLKHRTGIN
ncbi:MAG: hypothetical protein H6622_02160 [Halobacteriovoraceae bacterium]|nr:hypothetical protein [Halobacteriovoraceae bacterium]